MMIAQLLIWKNTTMIRHLGIVCSIASSASKLRVECVFIGTTPPSSKRPNQVTKHVVYAVSLQVTKDTAPQHLQNILSWYARCHHSTTIPNQNIIWSFLRDSGTTKCMPSVPCLTVRMMCVGLGTQSSISISQLIKLSRVSPPPK